MSQMLEDLLKQYSYKPKKSTNSRNIILIGDDLHVVERLCSLDSFKKEVCTVSEETGSCPCQKNDENGSHLLKYNKLFIGSVTEEEWELNVWSVSTLSASLIQYAIDKCLKISSLEDLLVIFQYDASNGWSGYCQRLCEFYLIVKNALSISTEEESTYRKKVLESYNLPQNFQWRRKSVFPLFMVLCEQVPSEANSSGFYEQNEDFVQQFTRSLLLQIQTGQFLCSSDHVTEWALLGSAICNTLRIVNKTKNVVPVGARNQVYIPSFSDSEKQVDDLLAGCSIKEVAEAFRKLENVGKKEPLLQLFHQYVPAPKNRPKAAQFLKPRKSVQEFLLELKRKRSEFFDTSMEDISFTSTEDNLPQSTKQNRADTNESGGHNQILANFFQSLLKSETS
ncbi:hypothetical protein SJAG_00113 [Schizosaccharomyces japonicus yFS275]|uniref:Uncharacterized protein n=1 Tax=Schizosaccharomyces japonicus (strain yFS275 / FY16936) TaxID=402676 RepID=B6JXH4_SCHJY|nr:hypothetical protein SJAG_00113 [Schizosaccharomyces japonicus yFS275]EEB05118.2 hypothetical protein SJAG_00113 [Schizosaccharomyces japonicus yFS275]